jgi:hypothetical protein
MKKSKKHILFLLIGFCLLVSLSVDAQWVTIARKVKSMRTGSTDIATVLIDAGTFNVYRAVIDTLRSASKFSIIKQDNTRRYVEFTSESKTVAMQVDSLAIKLTQITVAAANSGNPAQKTTDLAVEAIIKVCDKLGIKCTLEEQ